MEKQKNGEKTKTKNLKIYLRGFVLILTGLWLAGCISGYGNYISQYNFKEKPIVDPEIGVISTSFLGEPIISMGYGHYSKILNLESTYSKKDVTGGSMYIHKGLYELVFSDNEYEYYFQVSENQTNYINVYGEDLPRYHNAQIRLSKDGKISIILSNGFIMPGDYSVGFNYKIIDSMFIKKENSLQQTMLYLGKINNIVKFSYREFANDYIRASFTTEISYDLSESTIIGFKNFKAEIIDASNTDLKYKIISSF